MQYADLDNTYLQQATDRIATALASATGIATVVTDDPGDSMSGTFWAVMVTDCAITQNAQKLETQTYTVLCMYVHEPAKLGERRDVYRGVYGLLPVALNYLKAHKNLKFAAADTAIPYLNPENVGVTIRSINDPIPGWAVVLSLPFNLVIDQARYG